MTQQTAETGAIQLTETPSEWTKVVTYHSHSRFTEEEEKEIGQILQQINILSKKRDAIARVAANRAIIPSGWVLSNIIARANCAEFTVQGNAYEKEEKKNPVADKLSEALKRVDAKTLFHSNVLSRKEKRELLGLEADDEKSA